MTYTYKIGGLTFVREREVHPAALKCIALTLAEQERLGNNGLDPRWGSSYRGHLPMAGDVSADKDQVYAAWCASVGREPILALPAGPLVTAEIGTSRMEVLTSAPGDPFRKWLKKAREMADKSAASWAAEKARQVITMTEQKPTTDQQAAIDAAMAAHSAARAVVDAAGATYRAASAADRAASAASSEAKVMVGAAKAAMDEALSMARAALNALNALSAGLNREE